ncbi:hypothetical protein ELH97_12350 [Rhizobium leguminosarum]|nr:hypothetical protein ELI06_12500 [Rhizobium leguminosarum]TAX39799.1 hypothetical protein ELI05_12880 [Rhizobium leguminosarum]TAX92682.1 hypothetical protein ELH97_12350 [Rhizobium leguminosarum]TAX97213.1 hypothetical protein ELH94_12180 [Rhizobium leguminosarum]TAY88507.1 hypothetical protein ELH83_12295 [Rhizobium leguminosarum]
MRYHKEDYRTLLDLHPVHSEIHARGAITHSLRGMRRADVLKATLAWKNAAGKSKYATSATIWPVKLPEWLRMGRMTG